MQNFNKKPSPKNSTDNQIIECIYRTQMIYYMLNGV